jgi:hypothetical protein
MPAPLEDEIEATLDQDLMVHKRSWRGESTGKVAVLHSGSKSSLQSHTHSRYTFLEKIENFQRKLQFV